VTKLKHGHARWFTFSDGIPHRPLTELVCSGSFWRGFANGFSADYCFHGRPSYRALAESDTLGYAWNTVGQCLNSALEDAAVIYGRGTTDKTDEPEFDFGYIPGQHHGVVAESDWDDAA
jgi:hypothetical protein